MWTFLHRIYSNKGMLRFLEEKKTFSKSGLKWKNSTINNGERLSQPQDSRAKINVF